MLPHRTIRARPARQCPSPQVPFVVRVDEPNGRLEREETIRSGVNLQGSRLRPTADATTIKITVAVAMADGPAAGLAVLRRLEAGGALAGYYLLPATRADFLRRLGRNTEAAADYEQAAALARTAPERRFLNARLAELRRGRGQA